MVVMCRQTVGLAGREPKRIHSSIFQDPVICDAGGRSMKKQSTGSEKSEEAGEGRWGFSETLPEKEMRTWVQVGETVVGHEKTLVLWGGG